MFLFRSRNEADGAFFWLYSPRSVYSWCQRVGTALKVPSPNPFFPLWVYFRFCRVVKTRLSFRHVYKRDVRSICGKNERATSNSPSVSRKAKSSPALLFCISFEKVRSSKHLGVGGTIHRPLGDTWYMADFNVRKVGVPYTSCRGTTLRMDLIQRVRQVNSVSILVLTFSKLVHTYL